MHQMPPGFILREPRTCGPPNTNGIKHTQGCQEREMEKRSDRLSENLNSRLAQ